MYLIHWCGYTANKGLPFVTGIANADGSIPSPAPASSQAMGDYYANLEGRALGGYRPRGGYGTATPPNSIIDNVAYANKIIGGGGVYSTNIKMTNTSGANNVEPTLQSLLNHQWDSFLNTCVTDVKKVNGQVYMEIWSEANVGNNGTAQPPASDGPWADADGPNNAAAVARWRDWFCYIVNYFDSHGVTNVKYVMSFGMSSNAVWSNTSGNLKTFAKPVFDKEDADGKRYIDIIGADTYAKNGEGPAQLMDAPRTYCANISNTQHPNGIPLGIFESGYPGSHTVVASNDTGNAQVSYPAVTNKKTWYDALLIYLRHYQSKIVCFTNNMGESNGWWPEGSTPPGAGTPLGHGILADYRVAANPWQSFLTMTADPIFAAGGGTKTSSAALAGTGTLHASASLGNIGRSGAATLSGLGVLSANSNAPGLTKRNASSGSVTTNTVTPTFHSTTLSGNVVVFTVFAKSALPTPVVVTPPSGSAAYQVAFGASGVTSDGTNQGWGLWIYYLENCNSSEAAPSITLSAAVNYIEWELSELQGLVTSSSLDIGTSNAGFTVGKATPMNIGPTAQTNLTQEWAVGAVANYSGTAPSAPTNGYLLPGNAPIVARLMVAFKPLTALGATSFSATGDSLSQFFGAIVTFKGLNGVPGVSNWLGVASIHGVGGPTVTGRRGIVNGAGRLVGAGAVRAAGTAAYNPPTQTSATLTGTGELFAGGAVGGVSTAEVLLRTSDFPKATIRKAQTQ